MEVCYRYDGTFDGLLCCIFESYVNHEWAAEILTTADPNFTLWDEREVATDPGRAGRVRRGLVKKTSPTFLRHLELAHLTCMPDRDMTLYSLIRRGLDEGRGVERDLTDPAVANMTLALRHLWGETEKLRGFTRFSDAEGVLVGEVEPKNRLLTLLGPFFADRLRGEKVVLYDRTHREALFCQGGRWAVLPAEDFHLGPAGAEEKGWRALWRRFYAAVSIQGRENPRCQNTHLPKRYRPYMTEFQTEGPAELPVGQT